MLSRRKVNSGGGGGRKDESSKSLCVITGKNNYRKKSIHSNGKFAPLITLGSCRVLSLDAENIRNYKKEKDNVEEKRASVFQLTS